jgi:hypothetical protein
MNIDMKKYSRILLLMALLVASTDCTFHASKQDPERAATSAVEFAKAALINRDFDKAYSLLDSEVQSNASKETFAKILSEMNSKGSPIVITATEFEPIPGQEGMNIYLNGEAGSEKFHYRVLMKGNGEAGYKPAGILRGWYAPSNSRQPLQIKRSTGG